MATFIPQGAKIFNDQEPPWINNKVKTMIQGKNKIYQLYLKNEIDMLATKRETLQKFIYETLESCKSKYKENISKKLCSKAITPKYYWSLLKIMLIDKQDSLSAVSLCDWISNNKRPHTFLGTFFFLKAHKNRFVKAQPNNK